MESGQKGESADAAGFAVALRDGIAARGLSLERIRTHLSRRGVSVSLATLSYWQSGRSQPQRRESMAAVAALEEILQLAPGTLSDLIAAPRSRGRASRPAPRTEVAWPSPAPVQSALARIDARWDDRLTRLSVHDRVRMNGERVAHTVHTRQVLRAEQDGADRALVIYTLDESTGQQIHIRVRHPSRLGRVASEPEHGVSVAEMLFDRPLARGETVVVEHAVLHRGSTEPTDQYERRFRYPVREYLLEVTFHPDALPARCVQYGISDGPQRLRALSLDGANSVHHLALGVPPGRIGVRFEWD